MIKLIIINMFKDIKNINIDVENSTNIVISSLYFKENILPLTSFLFGC